MSELYIKMNDEEYQKYKELLYKDSKKQVSIDDISVIEFFELKGYKIRSEKIYDNILNKTILRFCCEKPEHKIYLKII